MSAILRQQKCFRNCINSNTTGPVSDITFLCPQTSAQQALTGTINSSMHAVQAAQAALDDFDTLPPLGTDAVRLNHLHAEFKLNWCDCWVISRSLSPEGLFSLFKASQAWRKNKMDESKHEIHSQVDAITAGTASMVNLTAGRNTVLVVFSTSVFHMSYQWHVENTICWFLRENLLVSSVNSLSSWVCLYTVSSLQCC